MPCHMKREDLILSNTSEKMSFQDIEEELKICEEQIRRHFQQEEETNLSMNSEQINFKEELKNTKNKTKIQQKKEQTSHKSQWTDEKISIVSQERKNRAKKFKFHNQFANAPQERLSKNY